VTANPERLTEGQWGPLLKEGNRELAVGLDQPAAFRRLSECMPSSRAVLAPWHAYWLAPAAVLALVAFAVLPTVVRRVRSGNATIIVAESLRGRPEKPGDAGGTRSNPSAPPTGTAAPQRTDSRSASGAKHSAHGPSASVSSISASPPIVEQARQALPTPAPAGSRDAAPAQTPASDVATTPDCLSLARAGQTRDAEACFLKRAEGSGLGAEMALYEVARLRRDVLGDAAGALRALAEYRTRFPAGSLRREADMSQLELLVQLGRTDEALRLSEELLSSSASGERATELHLLRGHILRKTRSFAAAAHEYELVESATARRGDVIYFHALCLEALGRTRDAAAFLTQYLEQPQHSYAEDARRRLERLKQ